MTKHEPYSEPTADLRKRQAWKIGWQAHLQSSEPYCPFTPDCSIADYEAWHLGWLDRSKAVQGEGLT